MTDPSDRPRAGVQAPRIASFFSGIGGIDLGFQAAGFDIAFQCEVDAFCMDVLERHWPDVPRWANIKELEVEQIPDSDAWVGGFPCQDVSLARMGARRGLRGKQSGLFFEFARLIGEFRPRVLLLENVAGLLSSHGGRDMEIVLRTLGEFGYSVGWRTLNSYYFGVPQSRQRVYIVGCHRDRAGPGSILFESERGDGDAPSSGSNGKTVKAAFKEILGNASSKGPVIQAIAYCLYACSARHTGTDWSRNYVCYPKRGDIRRLTPRECEGVMRFPEDWTIPDRTRFGDEEVNSKRYYALGNAVTPPVAEWLGSQVKKYLDCTPGV